MFKSKKTGWLILLGFFFGIFVGGLFVHNVSALSNKTYEKFVREHLEGVWFESPVALSPLEYEPHQQAVLTELDAEKEYLNSRKFIR